MTRSLEQVVEGLTLEEKIQLVRGRGLWKTADLSRHGIESRVMTDGTYGVRYNKQQMAKDSLWDMQDFLSVVRGEGDGSGKGGAEALLGKSEPATCFPNGSNLSCAWDVELMYLVGAALADECHHYGVDVLLGPGVNIRRTPLAGRGYEYYSEDPVVTGELAGALINGLQDGGVGAVLKHFACNNSEFKRTEMNSVVDERTLREIYLSGFKRAIDKSNPWAVMSSYNDLNGQSTSGHSWLLSKVLRTEWGYEGVVISDWYGVKDCGGAIRAGSDLIMPEVASHAQRLRDAVNQEKLAELDLDRACTRILKRLNLLPVRRPSSADFTGHHRLAQRAAAESMVLLKNENDTLPIQTQKYRSIAVIGKPAVEPIIQGSGCATTAPFTVDIPLDELFELGGSDYKLNYAVGASGDLQLDQAELDDAIRLAKCSDVVLLFVSTSIGEDGENGDRAHLRLLPAHEALIDKISEVNHNVVVVLSNSDAVVMPWIGKVSAVVETFFAGQGMGRAIAEIVFGARNPCGKLTVTVPNTLEETPAWLYYPGEHLQHFYSEGIFVGYRYYDKRCLAPLFPFGFGLSYSSFRYESLSLSTSNLVEGERLIVQATIFNESDWDGKEIVQLYVMPPAGRVPREVQALKAFEKITVPAGEKRVVTLSLVYSDFGYFDVQRGSWVVEPGEYKIHVSRSAGHRDLVAEIHVSGDRILPSLTIHSSLGDVIEHPLVFGRVVELVCIATGRDNEAVRDELVQLAPQMVVGTYIALVEMMGIDISMDDLQQAVGT